MHILLGHTYLMVFLLSIMPHLLKHFVLQSSEVYELFSVMIHSGNALGGHYYAYIKLVSFGRFFKYFLFLAIMIFLI